jgi:hypothetical protein
MGLAELQQVQEIAIGQRAGEMHARGVVLAFDFLQKEILPFPLGTNSAIADASFTADDHNARFRAAALQLGDGADERVAAAIGLQRAIHKGDDRLTAAQLGGVWKFERQDGGIGMGVIGVDAVMDHTDRFLPVLRESAALKGGGANIPAAGFESELNRSIFHHAFG